MRFCASLNTDKVDLGEEFVSGAGVATVARALEDAGFDAAFVTEHPFPDDGYLGYLGHHALDPFVTLATAAAATTRLRIMTHICVVPYHNPYVLAKSVATLDAMSGGRVILGCGTGYMATEFAAVGAPFEDRNERFDAAIVAMKQAWSGEPVHVEASGTTHTMRPVPVQRPHPPIWIGGNSRRALRRAVELGDGWDGFANPPERAAYNRTPELDTLDRLEHLLDDLRELEQEHRRSVRDIAFSLIGVGSYGTDAWDAAAFREVIGEYEKLGVTMTLVNIPARSREEYCELVRGFGADVLST
jgi:probable F420-dependent oxidoreductase